VYQTTADNYFAPKTGYHAPTQPFLEGAWPWFHPYFTPNSLCWLCVLLPLRWPRRSATPPPVPATPIKPTRKRATEPTAFAGLTHTPPCALCEPEAGETPPAPLQRPDPMPPTHRRPRSVDTSMHFCPHTACDSRGWLGMHNLRANGYPNGGPWRHPPPQQVALWRSGKPRARRKANTNSTNALPSPSSRKEVAAS